MKTFRNHLNQSLKDPLFKEMYNEEKELLRLSLALNDARKKAGISQQEIAHLANLTQQQVSKLENGENCNIMTYLKASHAIGAKIIVQPRRGRALPQLRHNKRPRAMQPHR
jgi:HTH-type transcriptional regulator / antitoxin HipB